MAPLAFTLLTTAATGSYRLGGVMMAVYVVAEMAGAVPVGRLLDRVGPARGLPILLGLVAAGFAVLAYAAATGASGAVLVGLVVLPGLAGGGLSGGFRSLLADTVAEPLLQRAISVDVMILEGVLVGGPALVTVLALAGTSVPLLVMAAASVCAAALVPRRRGRPERVISGDGQPRTLAACVPWLCCGFTVGLLLSTIEVAPLPLVQRLGAPATFAPIVIAVLCGTSIAGNAVYAWRGTTGNPLVFLSGFVVGGSVLAADLGWVGLLAGVSIVGVCASPLVIVTSVNLQRLLPENRRSEGFSLSFVVQSCGFGLGSLAVGVLPLWLAPLFGVFSAAAAGAMLVARPARSIGTLSVPS